MDFLSSKNEEKPDSRYLWNLLLVHRQFGVTARVGVQLEEVATGGGAS